MQRLDDDPHFHPLARSLRWTLLAALGVVQGCGGTTTSGDPGTANGGSGTTPPSAVGRPTPAQCSPYEPRPDHAFAPVDGGFGQYACLTDADCTERGQGLCESTVQIEGSYCLYGCETDADCQVGQVCDCPGGASQPGRCVGAGCTTDADCGGGACLRTEYDDGCGPNISYNCQTPADECASDADCGQDACTFEGTHVCRAVGGCAIGRPFLIEGQARTAAATRRAGWVDGAPTRADVPVSAAQRTELAERWTSIGLMEHASIAAFARFSLQLLSLGAPPELLIQSQRAMADETEHARMAFRRASDLAGHPVGPGRLDVAGALGDGDVTEIVLAAFLEGCIGETVASLEASLGAQRARDESVREDLRRVAQDEARHAELAWRFVQWALRAHPAVGRQLGALLERERTVGTSEGREHDWLWHHGLMPEAERPGLRRMVIDAVVRPCLREVLAGATRPVASAGEAGSSRRSAFA